MPKNHYNAEAGNAFWIILLAIALLVALTVTITRSNESSQETGNRDRNRIMATDILRQAKSIQQAVDQLRLNGVAENQISFDNTVVAGYSNIRCGDSTLNTDDDTCKVFHQRGTGLTYKIPSAEWLDKEQSAQPLYGEWYFFGTACVPGIGTGGAGCNADDSATDLIIALSWLTEDLCIEINRLVGVENSTGPLAPPGIAASTYDNAMTKFTGTFTATNELDTAASAFTGRPSGCYKTKAGVTPDRGFHFYHVLIAR